ncbi:uncharacterized protein RCO7_01901 [Rhynchosporium graminicola]|uniref:DUF676 domain-containing protein n=1 Tax=Rhynchosporium graminicola TaxID=2792576 RepID=A0A1E1KU79_9HELO|nr:uncharacterized protein RCO7_01901 [Rhynchosporium commune]
MVCSIPQASGPPLHMQGSAIKPEDIKRYEVTEVYTHPDAKVDIVLVHGLNGNPRNTWTAPNGVFWPSQLLPASLKSFQARILVYGYNADVYTFGSSKGGPSSDTIHQHAQTLLANLALERKSEDVSEHPIIWVAHSLGGILVKRALELSFDLQGNHDDDLRSIFVSTFGVIFLGTPHTGVDPAKWGVMLQGMVNALVPKKLFDTHSQLVKTLQSNNETLQNVNLKFLDIYPNRLRICMAHEGHPTDLKGTKRLIVDQIAASPQLPDVQYFGIEATHSGMCKFGSKNAPGFTNVSVTLRMWVQECPGFIQTRWDAERFLRKQKREDEIAQLQRLSGLSPDTLHLTSTPNTPEPGSVHNSMIISKSTISIASEFPVEAAAYFIKPSGFRPNSLFVGREAELEMMHKMLFDKKKRADGTSAVLLQSLPGGGKTHLARQYVFEHKDDFPGGIFWLRAKSETELAAGFWDIACKAALKHPVGSEGDKSQKDPEHFITMVRNWLDNRHDWLMVLDGIHFTHSALRKFIPDSTNTSLIYTSTEKSVIGDHHFMNPQMIKLPLLSAREAQKLLLLELGKTEPFAKDDLRYSMELVQSMGFLPVVIHAVAQRLKTTDEPLSKFAKSYSSEPRLRGLGTYIAVVEQLKNHGAKEALNLINILCFFSQHIPVEMISLGLKALPSVISVKAFEPVSGHSLNNTFKILNTFALIDRNDHEHDIPIHKGKDPSYSAHSSQSQTSKGSRDMLADNVDVIRLHSVVQGFFIDTLASSSSATFPDSPHPLSFWLDLSVRLFCVSYDMAHFRISRKTHAGLVEDYRLYEIHGNKLAEHLAKQLFKSTRLSSGQKEILREAEDQLAIRLVSLRAEIERRTPESSIILSAGGVKDDVVLTSIFDRTSSSSDAGPETPCDGYGTRTGIEAYTGITTWGMENGTPESESPVHGLQRIYGQVSEYHPLPQQQSHFPFPPLSMPEDPGYETDRDEVDYAIQFPIPNSPALSIKGQHPSRFRRPRLNPLLRDTPLYRTLPSSAASGTRDLGLNFTSAIVPHLSYDHAQGFLQRDHGGRDSRSLSRVRHGFGVRKDKETISGQSSAEVALAQLRQQSPLSPGRGGMIRDREQSGSKERGGSVKISAEEQRETSTKAENKSGGVDRRGRMLMLGRESYAAPVAAVETGGGSGSLDSDDINHEKGSLGEQVKDQTLQRPHLSAMESLQRVPFRTNMPPYPITPALVHPFSKQDDESGRSDGEYFKPDSIYTIKQNENTQHTHQSGYDQDPECDQENSYTRRNDFLPVEHSYGPERADDQQGFSPESPSTPRFRQKGKEREKKIQSESLPASLVLSQSVFDQDNGRGSGFRDREESDDAHLMSLSYPGLQVLRNRRFSNSTGEGLGERMGAYHPRFPEFANIDMHRERGVQRQCESLPMSREGSVVDRFGSPLDGTGVGRGRRGSVAGTEPGSVFWDGKGDWENDNGVFEPREGGEGNTDTCYFSTDPTSSGLSPSFGFAFSPPQVQQQPRPQPSTYPHAPNPAKSPLSKAKYPSSASFNSDYTAPYPRDDTQTAGLGNANPRRGLKTSPPVGYGYLNPKFSPPHGFINLSPIQPMSPLNPNSSPKSRISPSQGSQISPRTTPFNGFGGEETNRHRSASGSGSRGRRGGISEPVNYVLAREVGEREGVLRSWGERERNERKRRDEMKGKRKEVNDVGLGILNAPLGDLL